MRSQLVCSSMAPSQSRLQGRFQLYISDQQPWLIGRRDFDMVPFSSRYTILLSCYLHTTVGHRADDDLVLALLGTLYVLTSANHTHGNVHTVGGILISLAHLLPLALGLGPYGCKFQIHSSTAYCPGRYIHCKMCQCAHDSLRSCDHI